MSKQVSFCLTLGSYGRYNHWCIVPTEVIEKGEWAMKEYIALQMLGDKFDVEIEDIGDGE